MKLHWKQSTSDDFWLCEGGREYLALISKNSNRLSAAINPRSGGGAMNVEIPPGLTDGEAKRYVETIWRMS
jgi:hypothetical protein